LTTGASTTQFVQVRTPQADIQEWENNAGNAFATPR
jgi:hypothetical protein